MQTDYRRFYYVFGVELEPSGNQLLGNCPFCYEDQQTPAPTFFVNEETGQWMCKRCGRESNCYGFMDMFNQWCFERTPESIYQELADNRGLTKNTLAHCQVSYNPLTQDYLIPSKTKESKYLTNLYRYTWESTKQKYLIKSAPEPCNQQIYGLETLSKQSIIILTEGHWDRMVALEMLSFLRPTDRESQSWPTNLHGTPQIKLKGRQDFSPESNPLFKEFCVLGLPGATSFNESILKVLRGKNVIYIRDNDAAGEQGEAKLISMVQQGNTQPTNFYCLRWLPEDVNDLRDCYASQNPLQLYNFIQSRLVEIPLDPPKQSYQVESRECTTFKELCRRFQDAGAKWTIEIEHTLATMLAVVLSAQASGGQIGLRVIGKPGSFKSTLAEAMSKSRDFVLPLSEFTGFTSGITKTSNTLASKLDRKCLILNEADTFMNLGNIKKLESEIRTILSENVVRSHFKSGKFDELELQSSFIICGTKELKGIDDPILGSRYVDIIAQADDEQSEEDIVMAAIMNESQSLQQQSGSQDGERKSKIADKVAPYVEGFLQHKFQVWRETTLEPISPEQAEVIRALGYLVSESRAKPRRTKQGELAYRAEKELPTRISQHLVRLSKFLSLLINNSPPLLINSEIMDILRRVATDTASGFQYDILSTIYSSQRNGVPRKGVPKKTGGISREQISTQSKIAMTNLHYILKDMQELDQVTYEPDKSKSVSGKGRAAYFYYLPERIVKLFDKVNQST